MAKAGNTAHGIVVNAPTELAASFWEALGFVPDRRDGHTHALTWRERSGIVFAGWWIARAGESRIISDADA